MVGASVPLVSLTVPSFSRDEGALTTVFNWAIYPGQQWAVTGPTASGKSLLVRAVAGMGALARDVVWSEQLGTYRSQVRKHVAYVALGGRPSGDGLFHQARWHAQAAGDSPTVRASLSCDDIWRRNPYQVDDAPEAEAAAACRSRRDGIMAALDLEPLLDRRLHFLSDGEWRRVQIGRALLRAPHLLILDDPFTGFDKDFRPRLRALLDGRMQTGTQLLLVIPDLADLPDGITHILVLDEHGHAIEGPRDRVLGDPVRLRRYSQAASAGRVPPPTRPASTGDTSPAPGRAVVRMDGVNVTHNGLAVLRDIAWTVRRGERWALVGPNGAGKTTLLSLILGDHPQAYANPIELFGRRRGSGESIWEIKRRIGWVAPELHRYFPPAVTVADVVASGFFDTLGLFRHCTDGQQAQTQAWLARSELAAVAERPFRALSKGEQRLALIARALVKAPDLLILDEPCQGLDGEHRARVLQALDALTPECGDPGPSMIYVTHRPEEFPRSLTHVLELDQGRVIRQAPVGSVL